MSEFVLTMCLKPVREIILACAFGILTLNAFAATLVVNPSKSGADDGGPASEGQPLRTIGAAMKRLQPGDRVSIAAGTYREAIIFPTRRWGGAEQTIIEGDPRGGTLIKGSRIVTDWRDAGAGRFTAAIDYEPEQVFMDGQPLQQIEGTIYGGYPEVATHPMKPLFASNGGIWPGRKAGQRADLPVNSFHYDKRQGDVMIRVAADQTEGHVIEVAAIPHLLLASGVEHIVLRNLSFEHSNTTARNRGGAVQIDGNNVRIENVSVRRADGGCLGLNGSNHQIVSSQFSECGQMGMGGRGSGWKILDVTVRRNNSRGFNKNWEAGGAKFVGDGGLVNATISKFKAIENFGDGLWFDYNNHDNRITDSLFAFNAGFGLHVEVSKSFLIDHNIAVGNRQRGMYLRQSSDCTIAFNLIAGNGLDGVAIIAEGPGTGATNNWVAGNVFAWNQIALTFPQPVGDNQSDGNAFTGDAASNSVRISWGKTVPRADWIARALDANSEWMDLPKTQTPNLDPSVPIEDQLKWYRSAKGNLRPLSEGIRRPLKDRAPALEIRADTRPGP